MKTELRELVSTLMRERDEARAEVERLRAVVQDLCEVLEECVYEIDTRYGPPGSNNIDRELIERARAVMAKAKIDPLHITEQDKTRAEVKRLRAALAGEGDDKHERVEE